MCICISTVLLHVGLYGCVQMQVQEVMRDNAALKRRIEAMEADIQRRADTDRDKFSVGVSQWLESNTMA